MSIRDVDKINATQIETLKRKQGRELARLEEGHKELKAELKKVNELELVDIQHENIQKVAGESDKKEKVLTQMKAHLDETRKLTDREIRDLKEHAATFKKEESVKLSNERERLKGENDLYLEEMNYRFGKEHQKITNDSQSELADIKRVRGAELSETQSFYQDKINHQTTEFTEKFQTDNQKQKKMKDDLEKQFKTDRMSTNLRQQRDIAKLTDTHVSSLEVRDNEFRKGLKEQDLMFEKKYADSMETRSAEFSRLEDLNKKVLTKMKDSLSETLKMSVNRADDPFYSFTELRPELKQTQDSVEIRVPVPEHAKTDLQLTIHGKEAIINFNRRYDDARKVEGVTNKLHKVESFTSRLLTDLHLDPKSVKSSYENGVMTYTIKKS